MTTRLELPEKTELVTLVNEMLALIDKHVDKQVETPSGFLLGVNNYPTKFVLGKSREMMMMVGTVLDMRSGDINIVQATFVAGAVWGYYNNRNALIAVIESDHPHEMVGLSEDDVQNVIETISNHTSNLDNNSDEQDRYDCWLVGCYVGDYFVNLDKVMEGAHE